MLPENQTQSLLVFEKKGIVSLFWRAREHSTPGIFSVESADGKTFKKTFAFVALYRADGTKTILGTTPELRANTFGTKTILSFLDNQKNTLFATVEKDGAWKVVATTDFFRSPTVITPLKSPGKVKVAVIAFGARETTRNSQGIFLAESLAKNPADLTHWKDRGDVLTARPKLFDASHLSPFHTEITSTGILLLYSARNTSGQLTVGAALFDPLQPQSLLWRSDEALWQAPEDFDPEAVLLGGGHIGKYFHLYFQEKEGGIQTFPIARYWETIREKRRQDFVLPARKKGVRILLERFSSNPVLEPLAENSWEAFATFNPAAIALGGRIHLLYRAQGHDGLSVLGYASSKDGIRIDEREAEPAFVPSRAFDTPDDSAIDHPYPYVSGGGTGGCEDPRLVEIEGRVYLIYVAFDGANPPGVALSHISKADFLAKRWRWSRPKLISEPGQIQKNWVLFPEKIGGKYVILHGLSPKIRIEYVDDLKTLGDGKYIRSLSSHGGGGYVEAARLGAWDNIVRGAGPPPLRTKHGWLVFYHGMDMRDPGKYKVGVMLLDLEHPENILCRAMEPVLEPETAYENSGHKRGVVYVCGAVIQEGKLFVYYGASDRTTAVAMTPLDRFLEDLLQNKAPTLSKMNLQPRQ